MRILLSVFVGLVLLSSCRLTRNPSIQLSRVEAREQISLMARAVRTPDRPIVVLGGWRDVGLGPWWMSRDFARVLCDRAILPVSFGLASTFDECADAVIEAVEERFPSDGSSETCEVDVVAVSMGGLVARYAASSRCGSKRLAMRRLFSVSSPHRGARLADALGSVDPLGAQMKSGSAFLESLDRARREHPFECFPYTRLSDAIVGEANCAPTDELSMWVSAVPLEPSHVFAPLDPLIRADIMRRLRSEPPIFQEPRSALP